MRVDKELRQMLIDNGWTPPKDKEIVLKYGSYFFNMELGVLSSESYVGGISEACEAGVFRRSMIQAELAYKAMIRRNRLSALAEQLGNGETEFNFGKNNYYIVEEKNMKFSIRTHYSDYGCNEIVYMDEYTAKSVCEALNKRIFKL